MFKFPILLFFFFCRRAFAQQQLRILFNDFLPYDNRGTLRFSPPEDPRISVIAKLRSPTNTIALSSKDTNKRKATKASTKSSITEDVSTATALADPLATLAQPEGKMTLRYQPNPDTPWTFCDIKAKAGDFGSTATVRGCYFNPSYNAAVFGILPLISDIHGDGGVTTENLRMGLRYTAPSFSSGAIVSPFRGELHSAWAVGKAGGLILGVQTEPRLSLDPGLLTADKLAWQGAAAACKDALSWGVAYQPEGQSAYGRGVFTAAVELRRRRELAVSFMHHIATQRNVVNPLEKTDVVGITNYIDLAFQLVTDLTAGGSHGGSSQSTTPSNAMRVAAAWQANKNVQVKARLGLDGTALGVVLKSWWHPAFTLGFAISKPFSADGPSSVRLGMTATLESYRSLRYERSAEGQRLSGARVTQRHVASEEDMAYHKGQGLLVPLQEVDNPEILGQQVPTGANYM